jgi:hypothetical protein
MAIIQKYMGRKKKYTGMAVENLEKEHVENLIMS